MRVRLNKRYKVSMSSEVELGLHHYLNAVQERHVNVQNLTKEWAKLVGLFPPTKNLVYEGMYYVHLLNWLCNILIVNSEEFYQDTNKVLDYVLQFLDLKRLDMETYTNITTAIYNHRSYDNTQRLSLEEKTSLLEVYRPFNKVLLELLQWNSTQWDT